MRLQTRHDPDGEVALAGQRANGDRDGAGGDTGDLAAQDDGRARIGVGAPTAEAGAIDDDSTADCRKSS